MIYLEYIFSIGVIGTIFGVLWGLISAGISLLLNILGIKRELSVPVIKGIGYYILASLAAFVTLNTATDLSTIATVLLYALGAVLVYFIVAGNMKKGGGYVEITVNGERVQSVDTTQADGGLLLFSILFYFVALIFPWFAENRLTVWFQDTVETVYAWPVIGWLVKIAAFFFLVGMMFRGIFATHKILSLMEQAFGSKKGRGNDDPPSSKDLV